MKRALLLLSVIGLSAPAFAAFHGPIQTSIGLMLGKSMSGVHGQASFVAVPFEYSRAFLPRTAVTWGFQPFFIQQPNHFFVADGNDKQTAFALQLTLGLRHEFGSENANTRAYVDIGSGPMWSNKKVPVTSSTINFDSYGTIGATFRARNGRAPYVGFRFQHISNAGIVADRNPGYNIGSIVFGIRLVR